MNRTLTRHRNRCLRRQLHRPLLRRSVRPTADRLRGPDELAQAITAFRCAIRCHKRLARLAPRFFDATTMARDNYQRAERRRWMEGWEPIIRKVYGPASATSSTPTSNDDRPPLPHPRTRRAVDREFAGWQLWLDFGSSCLTRFSQRRPHALPGFARISQLIEIAFAMKQLASGSFEPDPKQEAVARATFESDLRRAYGHPRPAKPNPMPPAPCAAPSPPAVDSSKPPAPTWPPPDDKRDLVPYAIVRGEHGMLCLKRIEDT